MRHCGGTGGRAGGALAARVPALLAVTTGFMAAGCVGALRLGRDADAARAAAASPARATATQESPLLLVPPTPRWCP